VSDLLRRLILPALLGVTFACCLPSLDAPFTHDEEAGIAVNRAVHPGATLRDAATYRFSPDQTRPLFFVTLLLEGRIHGLAPRGYRVLSLLMHLACGVVVYILLRRLRPVAEGAALTGSAFFLLHPLQSESIIYIWGRSGVQSALLGLTALAVVPWDARRVAARWVGALALMTLALAAKEEAVALPLMAFIYWVFAEARAVRPALARAAALAAPVAAFVTLRPILLGAVGRQVFARGLADNILGQAVVALRLTRLTLLPIGQSFDPAASVPSPAVGALATLLCLVVVAVALVGGLRLRAVTPPSADATSLRWICAGLLMAAAGFVIYWIVPLPDLMSERRVYLSFVGGALVVHGLAALLVSLVRERSHAGEQARVGERAPALAWLPTLVVTLLLAPALHARARIWSDPRQVWEEASRLAPERVRPYIDLGVMAAMRGDGQAAGANFDRAVALEPHNPEALYNRGKLRLDAGDIAGAATDLESAVATDPTIARTRINLAIVRIRQGNLADAEAQLRAALAIDPGDPRALTNLGEVLRARGHADEAIALYRQALASDATYTHAAARLGVALEALGDTAGALAAYREYLSRGPESATDRAAVEEKVRLLSAGDGAPTPPR
jgi:protein O-mannosyl-transferase